MTDASNPTPPAPPPTPASPPPPLRELEIKFKGQAEKYDLTDKGAVDRLTRDAQLGRQYLAQQEALKAMQDRLKEKEAVLRRGEQIEAFANRSPAAARAVAEIVRQLEAGEITPEQALAATRGQPQSQTDKGEPPTSGTMDTQTRAVLSALEARQQAIVAELESQKRMAAQKELTSEIDTLLASDDVLRGRPALRELVRERIQKHLDDGKGLEEATTLETTRARHILAEQVQTERDQRLANQDLRTTSPNSGTPLTRDFKPDYKPKEGTSARERTLESLKAVSGKAREYARAMMRGAVQGP